jgi:hypothetical protein
VNFTAFLLFASLVLLLLLLKSFVLFIEFALAVNQLQELGTSDKH